MAKSYLDYFLDNEYRKDELEKKKKVKKEWKFTQVHEDAILLYNSNTLSNEESEKLWSTTIYPSLLVIVRGVMEMPKFHNLPNNLDRIQLIDDALLKLVENLSRFTPGLVGKTGQPVKAFSYYSTIAKNLILEKCLKAIKVIDNKADVETSIDLSILSDINLQTISSSFDNINEDSETRLGNEIAHIVRGVEILLFEHNNEFSDYHKVGVTLVYILNNWHKIDFEKKNDFMRLLVLYTGLKQQNVSSIFKKYKIVLVEKGYISINSFVPKSLEPKEEENILIDEDVDIFAPSNKKEMYNFSSFEDFEQSEENKKNVKLKSNIKFNYKKNN